ncbi:MAG: hypothetical protein GXO39_01560 [Thermotogae bacterium]|nr:hypothetical protein [Thermotogota bacterium]
MLLVILTQLKLPPGLEFRTYETPHFLVHYHRGTEGWVPRVVYIAESLHATYSHVFKWSPDKINIVLVDAYDFSNGFSTPFPENIVFLYLQPPVGEPYFGSMEGWIEELLSHELIHTFHLDKPHPLWGILPLPEFSRCLFGRNPVMCAFPNLLDPGWQIEGIATYYESKGGFGRLNNRYFTDQMLAYVKDGGRLTPDLMSMYVGTWPFGRWYLWGGMYLNFLARERGEKEVVNRVFNSSYFEDPITFCSYGCIPGPYLLKEMGDFSRWKMDLRLKVLNLKRPKYRFLTESGSGKGTLSLSPSGRYLAYTENGTHEYPSLKVMDLRSGEVVRSVRALTTGSISWMGDSVVLFAQYRVVKNFYVFSDLYALHVGTGKVRRLTRGERAHSPVSTPYGVAYVRRKGPRQSIVLLGGEVLLRGKEGEGFTDLRFHRDTLYFTFYHHGWTDVAYLPWGKDSVRLLTQTREPSLLSYVGEEGVLFTENYTPVLFKDGEFRRLLNNPLSLLYPQPHGDSLVVLALRGKGLDVAVAPVRDEPISLPKDYRRETKVPSVSLSDSRPYNPIPHLLPKFWQPLTFAVAYGEGDTSLITVLAGLFTLGSDVLYRHFYSLSYVGGVQIINSDTSLHNDFYLSYYYDGLFPTLGLNLQVNTTTDPRFRMESYGITLEPKVMVPFNHIDGEERLGVFLFGRWSSDTNTFAVGIEGSITRAYAYKPTATVVADGFALRGYATYDGRPGFGLSGILALRKWLLLNVRFEGFALPYPYPVSLYNYPALMAVSDTFARVSVSVYPDIFSPNFPDIYVSIVPPSPWAFFSHMALTRVYPGLALEYLHYGGEMVSPYKEGVPHLIINGNFELLLASRVPLRLTVGYEVFPQRGFRVSLR